MELQVDGRAVFAATGGRPFDPRLPAVVFLHGAGMDHTVWALQTRYFTAARSWPSTCRGTAAPTARSWKGSTPWRTGWSGS